MLDFAFRIANKETKLRLSSDFAVRYLCFLTKISPFLFKFNSNLLFSPSSIFKNIYTYINTCILKFCFSAKNYTKSIKPLISRPIIIFPCLTFNKSCLTFVKCRASFDRSRASFLKCFSTIMSCCSTSVISISSIMNSCSTNNRCSSSFYECCSKINICYASNNKIFSNNNNLKSIFYG